MSLEPALATVFEGVHFTSLKYSTYENGYLDHIRIIVA
jgi:hypothetical protein